MFWWNIAEFASRNTAPHNGPKNGDALIDNLAPPEFGEVGKIARFRQQYFGHRHAIADTGKSANGADDEAQQIGAGAFEAV